MKKQRIIIDVESEEEIDESVLEGCWLYDEDFRGAITKIKIEKK
jgi:hypothetical protein